MLCCAGAPEPPNTASRKQSAAPVAAGADIRNFEVDGKLYTKWLYRNDDSQGVLSLGNPFWPDSVSGGNGVGGEVELGLRGRVSRAVPAGVASRRGA